MLPIIKLITTDANPPKAILKLIAPAIETKILGSIKTPVVNTINR